MKTKIIISVIIVAASFFAVKGFLNTLAETKTQADEISLAISSPKEFYSLGESVPITIRYENKSEEIVKIASCLDITSGNVRIMISQDGINFKNYSHSKWGISDKKCSYTVLNPKENFETSAKILWNFVPAVTNINKLSEEQLVTNYAFPTKGIYFIKAIFSANFSGKSVAIESEPVKVTINEPIGDDLEVWKKIKERGDIAYFIQEGELQTINPEERKKLISEIEQIINKNPSGLIVNQMEESLRKVRVKEEQIKAYQEKVKQLN